MILSIWKTYKVRETLEFFKSKYIELPNWYTNAKNIITGKITEKSGGSGGNFGLIYDTDQWKLEEFDTKENAYSLCEFIGNE